MHIDDQRAQVRRVLDAHGESRCTGLMHRDVLDIMGTGARLRGVVHRVGKALGHAVDGAALLVDGWLRSCMHGWPRASCHPVLVEPVLVCRSQTIARSSSGDRDVGSQQERQLVLVGGRVGVHHSVWAAVTKSVLGSPTFPRSVGLLRVVVAGGRSGAQA